MKTTCTLEFSVCILIISLLVKQQGYCTKSSLGHVLCRKWITDANLLHCSMWVQPDQCLTRTDGYLLADRASLERIRFQPLVECTFFFFKLNGPRTKVWYSQKNPRTFFRLSFNPVLWIDLFLRVILALILKQCSLWTIGLENVPCKDIPLHYIPKWVHWGLFLDTESSEIHSNQEYEKTDVIYLRAGSFCGSRTPCGKTRRYFGDVSLLFNFHFQIEFLECQY